MNPRIFFGLVVVGSFGVIYYVYQTREEEKRFMRRNVIKELADLRASKQD